MGKDTYNAYVEAVLMKGAQPVINELFTKKAPTTACQYISNTKKSARLMKDQRLIPDCYNDHMKMISVPTGVAEIDSVRISFMGKNRHEQYQIQRKYSARGIPYFNDEKLDLVLAVMKFLPPAFDDFVSPIATAVAVNEHAAELRDERNLNVVTYNNYQDFLNNCISVLVSYVMETVGSVEDVLIALLALTGRRCSEIASGQSDFEMVDHAYALTFKGQLKTKGDTEKKYSIHTLCPPGLVVGAYEKLIGKIGKKNPLDAEKRWNSVCNKRIKEILGNDTKLHALRALYLSATFQAFKYETCIAYNYFIQKAAGHSDISSSHAYTCCRVTGVNALPGDRIY